MYREVVHGPITTMTPFQNVKDRPNESLFPDLLADERLLPSLTRSMKHRSISQRSMDP